MRKDIFPTPMVVKIYLSSSTSDYILTKIVGLMAEEPQADRVFEALWMQYEWEMWDITGPDDEASYPFIASFLAFSFI